MILGSVSVSSAVCHKAVPQFAYTLTAGCQALRAEPASDSHALYSRMADSKIGTHLTNTVF